MIFAIFWKMSLRWTAMDLDWLNNIQITCFQKNKNTRFLLTFDLEILYLSLKNIQCLFFKNIFRESISQISYHFGPREVVPVNQLQLFEKHFDAIKTIRSVCYARVHRTPNIKDRWEFENVSRKTLGWSLNSWTQFSTDTGTSTSQENRPIERSTRSKKYVQIQDGSTMDLY